METPTINKTQKKSTLSAKKVRTKETIKNIVAAPYNNSYWPRISPEDEETLKIVLQNNLPRIKADRIPVPWRVIKNIPKPERREFRNNFKRNGEIKLDNNDRKALTFGSNGVTKLLEDKSAKVIFISSDVQPKIMVQHILDAAVLYGLPVIIFYNLRSLLSEVCGVTSAVICINKDVSPESKLNLIVETARQIFEKYPPPVDHINYKRSLQNEHILESSKDLENKTTTAAKTPTELNSSTSDSDETEATIYLKRNSERERAFVPGSSEKNINVYKMEVDSTGFLPLSTQIVEQRSNPVRATNYKSLVVKRLKGDPDRNKRKITNLKRKRK
ncbi:hypothetical protein NQ315_005826 [Exocentrus adspersus]|uniref:Ribosomal protein eL8/eL30/eS12/Gadd45 domain-containing protein n=1 Tax=Exocentrus adspersus TaxID=1586481 RepID=A0AAV8VRR2_9CUCU|nr:hypothetical protein NQ315_005826 [Exocentrus adspersus]